MSGNCRTRGLVLRCQRANLRHFPGFVFFSCVVAAGALASSLAQEKPHAPKTAPVVSLPRDAGRQIFESRCASCHGLDGLGGEHAPAIATRDAVGTRARYALAQVVHDGIVAKGMPSFASLSEAEVRAVVSYIQHLAGANQTRSSTDNSAGGAQQSAVRTERALLTANLDVQPQRLLVTPPAQDWPSYNGDYTGQRYSALGQINAHNVHRLQAQWLFHPGSSSSLEVTPVVMDGVMFVSSANDVYALDARTGHLLWKHIRPPTEGLIDDASAHHNRGVALWHARAFVETDNAHLLCLDARSGRLLWEITYADTRNNYGATSAPLIVKDKVLVGTSGGDDGVRGFLAAFDPESGKEAWRFWTIPAPGEPGSESWPGNAYLLGGGTTWMPGTYDPETNTVFWGTSNPAPDFVGDTRPGDDLYTDCVLALDADTGKLKWHFQFTPHDLYDFDATETPVLVDLNLNGELRKLLVEANRNGFLYVLDRTTGKFLSATPFVKQLNWARGINAEGRPIRTGLQPTPGGTTICPSLTGATNWMSPSYNPSTQVFYFMALEDCDIEIAGRHRQVFKPGEAYYNTGTKHPPGLSAQKILLAFDVATGNLVWRDPQTGTGDSWGGTMATASGLVFLGDDAGEFEAVDGQNGKTLWHFNTGQTFHASPMSYGIAGVQYVAIASGSDVFSFALPPD